MLLHEELDKFLADLEKVRGMAAVGIDKGTHQMMPVLIEVKAAQNRKAPADKRLDIVVDQPLVDIEPALFNAGGRAELQPDRAGSAPWPAGCRAGRSRSCARLRFQGTARELLQAPHLVHLPQQLLPAAAG